ncbi:MAG: polyketide synthase dehydratase domain-containing protein, partial [Gemmataceae bacterium]|nr:polyketide synthase dehydratase domain-containing protein [Gemmataceae bacterium]
ERDPLRAIALFSSSTARFGRKGQCDYAAANEVLNKMGRWLASRRPDCRVASINWGPWEGGMVTPELRRVFESEGVGLIPLKSGAEFLLAEWSRSDREVESIVLAPHATSEPQATAERAIADKAIAERATASPQVADHPAPMHPVWERAVCVESHPILESHVLDGRAVLPFALHLEWLGHAAMHGQPGIAFVGWDDAQILLGAKVEAEGSLDLFALAGRPEKTEGNLHIRAELHSRGRNGRESIHSRATVILGQRPTPAESARPALLLHPPGPAALRPYERLFHGEQLHAIERITGISDQGIEAVVRCAPPPSSWFAEPLRTNWLADPLAIDAAFQLVVFWSMERRGIPVLPTRFRRYRQFAPSFPPTSVRVLVEVLSASDLKLRVHIEWFAESGAVVARLDDGEFVGDAGMASAFRRNRLIRSAPVMIS